MKFLVCDTGLSVEHAVCLAKDGNKVKYHTPWVKAKPSFVDYAIGLGIEGIEDELDFYSNVDWADVICFFDTGYGDKATFLRNKGYTVYGAGKHGEELEAHRYLARQIQKDLGLPTQKTERIKGIESLREYLKNNKDVVVKHDIFRGDLESFVSRDFESSEQLLKDLSKVVGPFADSMYFMVEEAIEGIEPGFDLMFNGEEFIEPYLYGYEHKGAYIGCLGELPDQLEGARQKLGSYLKKINYRAAFSTEFRLDKKGDAYMIDVTARMPYPLSLGYCNLYQNFPEMVYNIANKLPVKAKAISRYMGCLPMSCEYAADHWVTVGFDESVRDNIKLQNSAKTERYYVIPGLTSNINIVAEGNSVGSVFSKLKEISGKVTAHDLSTDLGSLDTLKEIVEEGQRDYDISF